MNKPTDVFGIVFAAGCLIMYGLLDHEQKEHKKAALELELAELSVTALRESNEVCDEKLQDLDKLTEDMEARLMKNGCDKDPQFWFMKHNECRIGLLKKQGGAK
jgi:hypothetical protein